MQNFYNPYPPNMFGNPMPQMQNRPMFPEPQYMQQPVQSGMVWVKNRYEADNFPVPANTAVALWDSSGPYVHRKETDVSGRPVVKTFKLVEVTDAQSSAPAGEFVTREEFMQFVQSLNYQPKYSAKEETVNE